ncbi:MAG: serine hydrolase domain-containing protein [Saprospiraceae bacterium]
MRFLLICSLLLSFTLSTFAQQAVDADAAQAFLDEAINNGQCIGIAAGILKGDDILWSGKTGMADLEKSIPYTAQTVGRTASIAKPMTALAILQLVEQGKLNLDDKVAVHLPEFKGGAKEAITVRHVLQHSAGFRGYGNNKERNNVVEYPTFSAAMQIFINDDLLFTPGKGYSYTTFGYTVLGALIEKASGTSYEDYLRTHVWEPAGMVNTSVERFGAPTPGRANIYHQKKPGKIKAVEFANHSDRIPGGGVQSTVEDLLHFGHAVMNNTLLSAESLAVMIADSGLKTEDNGYGMGWYIYADNSEVFGHNGEQLGCSAFLLLAPKRNIVIAVMSNTSGAKKEVGKVMNGVFGEALKVK